MWTHWHAPAIDDLGRSRRVDVLRLCGGGQDIVDRCGPVDRRARDGRGGGSGMLMYRRSRIWRDGVGPGRGMGVVPGVDTVLRLDGVGSSICEDMTMVMVGRDDTLRWGASEEGGMCGRKKVVPLGRRDGVHRGMVMVIRGIAGEM